MNDITDVPASAIMGRAQQPGNDIDQLPDDSANNVEHTVSGILATLGESLHDRVKVALWRLNNPRDLSDQEYLSEYLPQEFTLDRVAQDFGGGYYRAVVRVPRLDKETGLPVGNVLMIAKAPRFKIGGLPKEPGRGALVPMVSGQPSNMDGAIKVMMDGMQAMMERLATAMQQPPQKTTLEMARELAELKTLFAPPPMTPAPDPLATALSQLSLMEKIKTLINPPSSNVVPDNPSDNAMLMTLLQGVLPTLLAAAQKDKGITAPVPQLENMTGATTPENGDVPAGEQPATDTPAPAPGAQPSEDDPVGLMQQAQELMLKAYVAGLVANARANNDIEPIAQEVYEKATDEMWEFLESPDALEKLAAVNKDVKLFPGWFERLRARLLEIDKAEPEK